MSRGNDAQGTEIIKQMGHELKANICQRCGSVVYAFGFESIECEEQIKVNRTHEWVIDGDGWECKRCKAKGGYVHEGPAVYRLNCRRVQMKRALR